MNILFMFAPCLTRSNPSLTVIRVRLRGCSGVGVGVGVALLCSRGTAEETPNGWAVGGSTLTNSERGKIRG